MNIVCTLRTMHCDDCVYTLIGPCIVKIVCTLRAVHCEDRCMHVYVKDQGLGISCLR